MFSRSLGVSGKCDCVKRNSQTAAFRFPMGLGSIRYILWSINTVLSGTRQSTMCSYAPRPFAWKSNLAAVIPAGATFYISAHRRDEVLFTPELRALTCRMAAGVMDLLASTTVPPAVYSAKCRKCSLLDSCSPKLKSSARSYCQSVWSTAVEDNGI